MTAQAALTADAIAGLRRATGREQYSSDSDDSIDRPTNRGNKLKRKAQYVHEGQLDRPNGLKVHKKRITHAGYERDILKRNPRRLDEEGDELEDDDVDEWADADVAARNPYSHIKLEDLLAPLTSAADLPTHPSLSVPYLSSTLTDMTQEACKMVQREKKSLWAVKNMLTKFRGDDSFISCGLLDADVDEHIFNTRPIYDKLSTVKVHLRTGNSSGVSQLSGRTTNQSPNDSKVSADITHMAHSLPSRLGSGVAEDDFVPNGDRKTSREEDASTSPRMEGPSATEKAEAAAERGSNQVEHIPDTTMEATKAGNTAMDTETIQPNMNTSNEQHLPPEAPPTHSGERADPPSIQMAAPIPDESPAAQSANQADGALPSPESFKTEDEVDPAPPAAEDKAKGGSASAEHGDHRMEDANGAGDDEEDSQPPPHRMTTRAQAQAVSDNSGSSRARTPSHASWDPPAIHPLYIMPEHARPDRDFGLPPHEAEETRRLLMAYVQKQEEVVRGAETMYKGLLRAGRMRQTVFKWCKAEGHIGEMSDGEDWYDKEEWGLEDDLKKGHDDEEEDAPNQGRKTRKTRQQ